MERPTLLERIVGVIPLPYGVASLILAAAIGSPGFILTHLLDGATLEDGVTAYFALSGQLMPSEPWRRVITLLLNSLLVLYVFWVIRHVRLRHLETDDALEALLPQGKADYRRLFGAVTRDAPAVILGVLILVFSASLPIAEFQKAGLFGQVQLALSQVVGALLYATVTWIYLSSVWGLYRLGRQPLRLKSYAEDRLLGVRPIGVLSLNVSLTFLGILAINVLITLVSPLGFAYNAFTVAMTTLGVTMFYLPLWHVHHQMREAKDREQAAAGQRLLEALVVAESAGSADPPADPLQQTLAELRDALDKIRRVYSLEMLGRQVARLPTWPIDVEIMGRLGAAVILPPLLALVAEFLIRTSLDR